MSSFQCSNLFFSPCNSPEHHSNYMVMGKLQALVYDIKKVLESDARCVSDGKSPESLPPPHTRNYQHPSLPPPRSPNPIFHYCLRSNYCSSRVRATSSFTSNYSLSLVVCSVHRSHLLTQAPFNFISHCHSDLPSFNSSRKACSVIS